jgi:hypothetical protein
VALKEYDNGQCDVRRIVRAIYERVDDGWCDDGEDPEDVVALWIRNKRFVNRKGYQLVAPREV